jgi:hypothetical protein
MAASAGTYAVERDTRGGGEVSTAAVTVDAPPSGILVQLSRLGPGRAPATVDRPASFTVQAVSGAPIAAFELWAGSELVATAEIGAATRATSATRSLDWVPEATGDAVVVARAIDAAGRTAQSVPIRVRVLEPEPPMTWRTVRSGAGETLAQLAARAGVDAALLLAADPALPATGALPVGTSIDVPIFDLALDDVDLAAAVPPELAAIGSPGGGGRSKVRAPAPSRPAVVPHGDLLALPVPELSVTVDDDECSADIEVAQVDGAEQLVVEQLSPTSPAFVPIGLDEGDEGSWSAPLGPGAHVFVAHATDGTATSISEPFIVNGPGPCEGTWTGDLKLVNGVLTGGASADVAYLYLSSEAKTWVRVPEAPGSFVPRDVNGGFDFTAHLPLITGKRLELDAWGWDQGELVKIGHARFTPPGSLGLLDVIGIGQAVSLDWIESPATPGTAEVLSRNGHVEDPGELSFRWKTSLPGVTHGVWQVTTVPPSSDWWLDPVGLVAQGTTDGDGGTFSIDFGPILGKPQTIALGDGPPSYAALAGAFGVPPPDTGDAVATVPPTSGSAGGAGFTIPDDLLDGLDLPDATQFWVRVLPFSKDHHLGVASNVVHLDTSPIPSPELIAALAKALEAEKDKRPYELDFSFTRPEAPDLSKVACWQFTGWDADKLDAKAWAAATNPKVSDFQVVGQGGLNAFSYRLYLKILGAYPPDQPLCPGYCYSLVGVGLQASCSGGGGLLGGIGDFFGAVWGMATFIWDEGIVKAFNYVKSKVVEGLVALTFCEQIGAQVSDDEEGVSDACGTLAEAAVDVTLMFFGIPPNLPTSGDLIQAAKGDLEAAIVELAEDLGVPCDELAQGAQAGQQAGAGTGDLTCEEAVGQMLDELDDQLQAAYAQEAQAVSGLTFPPGMKVVPHPAGQIKPSRFDITLTPTSKAPPSGETCTALANIHSQWYTGPGSAFGNVWTDVKGVVNTMMHTPSGKVGTVKHVSLKSQLFKGAPFATGHWKLPTLKYDGQGTMLPATKSYQLFQPIPYEPVAVSFAIQDPGGFNEESKLVFKAGVLPHHAFLLKLGSTHTATVLSPCTGIDAQTQASVDLANPQTKGVSG